MNSNASRVFIATFLFLLLLLASGCGDSALPFDQTTKNADGASGGENGAGTTPGAGGANPADSLAAFKATLEPVLQTNCAACHGAAQAPLFAVADSQSAHDLLVQGKLVDFARVDKSKISKKIFPGNHSGVPSAVSGEIETKISEWVNALAGSGSAPPQAGALQPTFASINQQILQPLCVSCHGPTLAEEDILYDSYQATLESISLPDGGEFFETMEKGEMPPAPAAPISQADLDVIAEWLAAGAPNN